MFRKIERYETGEGTFLFKSSNGKSLSFMCKNSRGKTNGAYVAFHGVLDNNYDDTDKGTVTITIEKADWPYWNHISTTTFAVENRHYTCWGTVDQGIDICTVWIQPHDYDYGSTTFRATVKFSSNSPTCNVIKIDRFEIMESSKK